MLWEEVGDIVNFGVNDDPTILIAAMLLQVIEAEGRPWGTSLCSHHRQRKEPSPAMFERDSTTRRRGRRTEDKDSKRAKARPIFIISGSDVQPLQKPNICRAPYSPPSRLPFRAERGGTENFHWHATPHHTCRSDLQVCSQFQGSGSISNSNFAEAKHDPIVP